MWFKACFRPTSPKKPASSSVVISPEGIIVEPMKEMKAMVAPTKRGTNGNRTILKLDSGALSVIMSLLDTKDILSLAQTCSKLRKEAMQNLGFTLSTKGFEGLKPRTEADAVALLSRIPRSDLPCTLRLEGSHATDSSVRDILSLYQPEMSSRKGKERGFHANPVLRVEIDPKGKAPISSSSDAASTASATVHEREQTFTGPEEVLLDNLSNLTWVSIAHVTRFVGVSLRVLSCKNMVRVTDMALEVVADSCPHLTKLNLMGCNKVTDVAILSLSRSCRQLQDIDFTGLSRLTSYSVIHLISSCPSMTSVVLSGCSLLDNSVVACIGNHLSLLRRLNLDLCPRIDSSADIALVMRRCKALSSLSLQNCRCDMVQVVEQLSLLDRSDLSLSPLESLSAASKLSFIGVKAVQKQKRDHPVSSLRLTRLSLRGSDLSLFSLNEWRSLFTWCGDHMDTLDLSNTVFGRERERERETVDGLINALLEGGVKSLRVLDVSGHAAWSTIRERLRERQNLTVISL